MPVRAAMILCAGLGTRLRPLTDWLAKPMVPIGDRPTLGHIAARLRDPLSHSDPLERIVVNVHHRPDDVRTWAERERVLVSEERDVLLGTAGGVARASTLLGDGDVLIWNGDIVSDLDASTLVVAHDEAGDAEATLAVVLRPAGEGNVGIGEAGRIVRLRTSSTSAREVNGADFIGVHVLGAAMRAKLPEIGCLVADVWIPALRDGAHLATHVVTSPFVDVGSIGAYVAANRAWLASRNVASWVAPDAKVSVGARIDGSIVGAGARVEADAVRCIVWPGAQIVERVEDMVVTPFGKVKVSSTLSSS